MLIKQITKSFINNKPALSLYNPLKRSFMTSLNKINIENKTQTNFTFNKPITSRNFFSSNKEDKKETKKEEESKKEEEKTGDETDKALTDKYKELRTLYNEQEQKLYQVKIKFHEIKDLYLKGIEEIDAIKLRNDREIKNTKDYAISKFAKDLLEVNDNFTRALSLIAEKDFKSLSQQEKDKTFYMFVEGK